MKKTIFYQIILVFLSFFAASIVNSQSNSGNKLTEAQWKEDISYLMEQFPNVHINPYNKTSKENFEHFSEVLISKLHNMSDNEIITEISKLTAMVGDGHTAMNVFGYHGSKLSPVINLHIFPMRLYLFSDGLYVTEAAPQYGELQGSRITKLGGIETEKVIERIKAIIPGDNEYSVKFNMPYYMVIPEFLNGIGVINNINELELTVIDKSGAEKNTKINSIELSSMQHNSGASDDNGLPLYMKNDSKNYWFEYLKDSKTLYINYKRVLIDPQDSLKNFCKRLEDFVNANEIERTVIDIRNNGGGNNATCQPFVNLVSKNPKMNRKGKLFVIIGRQTFAAASYLTTKLEFNTKAIFVGEPTGASPNHYGDNRPVILPNSKLEMRFSSLYWQNSFSFDKRAATEPSLRVEVSSRDYFSGNDPVLNAVLSYKPESAANTTYSQNISGTYLYSPLQTLEIKSTGNELIMLVMMSDFIGRNVSFISTSLYPTAGADFKTDIEGLSVSKSGSDLKCNFRGNEWVIKKAPADYKTPQQLLDEGKHNEAVSLLKEVRESNPAYSGLSEMVINTLGYYALGKKNYEGAIAVFVYNVELYPESSNVYDSLGEAYMMAGSYKEALDNYKRSVELNPKNENAKKMITNLSK